MRALDLPVPVTAPGSVRDALLGPGEALHPRMRKAAEPLLGRDLTDVRLHAGPAASESARALGARAYTSGTRIVLGEGHGAPDTQAGQRLVAHELAHVRQQADGQARGRLQAKPATPATPGKLRARKFWVKLDHPMGPDALLREFVRQYYGETDERKVQKKLAIWRWTSGKGRSATQADAAKGGLVLNVTDYAQSQMAAMSEEQRKKLNEDTDKRFWAETGYKPGDRLGSSAEDQEMARRWLSVRTDILLEQEQARAIHALPDDIKKILFSGGRQVTAEEYDNVLRLADKLNQLTPAERRDYLGKVTAGTEDWSELDRSIDRYIVMRRAREHEEEKTDAAAAELFGLEGLYRLYRQKQSAELRATRHREGRGHNPLDGLASEARQAFTTALRENGFASEREFTDAIEAYRLRFREEALHIAMELLSRFDNMLYLQRRKLQEPGFAAGMAQGIAATGAKATYEKAAEQKSVGRSLRLGSEGAMKEPAIARQASAFEAEGRSLHAKAEADVVKGSGNNPLIDPAALGRDVDREKLAGLDAAGTQRFLEEVIAERQGEVNKARHEFHEDPERVFDLPSLVAATKEAQGIGKDSIYDWIVNDHIEAERDRHLLSAIAKALLALLLAVLVPVGGWVAAGALIGGTLLSGYEALQAVKEYRAQTRDYHLQFIEDEPSLLWVGVAIAAAALDVGMLVGAAMKMSAAGLKQLEGPLKELAAATDAETAAARLSALEARIDAANDLVKVEGVAGAEELAKAEELAAALKRTLKAHARAEIGFNRALGKAMGGLSSVGALALESLPRALYWGIRKGVNTITKLGREAKIAELLGDAAKMRPAAREELKVLLDRVKKIVKAGEKKMDEETLLRYVDRIGDEWRGGEGAFENILDDVKAWRKPTAEQLRAKAGLEAAHENLTSLRRTREELEAELRAGPKLPDGSPDLERVAELRENLKGLSAEVKNPVTGLKESVPGRDIRMAEHAFAEAEAAAEAAKLDPKDLMRRAFNASTEREDVIKGVTMDRIGGLKTKPTKPTVDHIVSIKEMSEMDGFAKLTRAERKALAIRKDNLIVMDAAANSSKGERGWAVWPQASHFYDDAAREAMLPRAAQLRKTIQDWITDKAKGR